MAGIVSLNVDFQFGSNGTPSTLVDNSAKTQNCDFPREQDMKDVTAFNGNGARAFAVGLSSATFKAAFFWDATIDGQLQGLIGYVTAINFQFGPDGSLSGKPKYTGSMFAKSVGQPVNIGDIKVINCEFQITGLIVRATYP